MCRILAFYGIGGFNVNRVVELLKALEKSSAKDPHLERITRGRKFSHGDGWGFTIVAYDRDANVKHVTYRSLNPIYEEAEVLDNTINNFIKHCKIVAGILHTRAAGKGEPINILSTHPYHMELNDGSSLWFAHNGSVDKNVLSKTLNMEDLKDKLSDSYFAASYISSKWSAKGIIDILRDLIEYTRTALNTISLVLSSDNVKIVSTCYYTGRVNEEYYRMYLVSGEGVKAVASSTLVDYYLDRERYNIMTLRNREILMWTISFKGVVEKLERL